MKPELSKSYFYRFHNLVELMDTVYDQTLRMNFGLGLPQALMLYAIGQRQPISQQEIATFLNMTPGNVSREVSVMKNKGWVRIKGDSQDKRKQLLVLTPEGKKIVKAAYSSIENLLPEVYEYINTAETLDKHLNTLLVNLERLRLGMKP
jgi:DNA-binding MarR family transcriptional regulator